MNLKKVSIAADASGAVRAVKEGHLVVIIDIIDFSTTMEAVLDAGAIGIWGASPSGWPASVALNPEKMGWLAGCQGVKSNAPVIVVAEPRVGSDKERQRSAAPAIAGIMSAGAEIKAVVPNLGAETIKIIDFRNTIVLGISSCGGTAFDAAVNAGGRAVTATIARVNGQEGRKVAFQGISRALNALGSSPGLTMLASSSKAVEDLLAAKYLAAIYKKSYTCPRTHMI